MRIPVQNRWLKCIMANVLYSLKSFHSSEADVTHSKASTCQMDLRLIREEKPKSSPSPEGGKLFLSYPRTKETTLDGKNLAFLLNFAMGPKHGRLIDILIISSYGEKRFYWFVVFENSLCNPRFL